MSFLLDAIYVFAIFLASPWLIYGAIRHGKYRHGYLEKFLGRVPQRESARPCAWFHAVSVGEVNLLQPLLLRFCTSFPGWDCVISTTTKTGYELARKKYAGHTVFYCPLDFSWAVQESMRRVRPELLVLAELELWPNLIRFAKRSGCRVAVVNGRLSERSFRGYCRGRWFFASILQQIDLIAAQNEEYADRFRRLIGPAGSERVCITGSVKFDGTPTDRQHKSTEQLQKVAGIDSTDVVFLAGSTQEPEEELAVAAFRECCAEYPNLRLLIAPRHITRCDRIATMLDRSGIPWQRRTTLDVPGSQAHTRILLIDTIGELTAWWGTARIAFVGGSMGSRGGQNMIEPAGFGAAICFGTNTGNFRDVVRSLLQCNGACVVQDGSQLTDFVRRCLEQPNWAQAMGQRAQQLVLSQQGAADRTMRQLREMAGEGGMRPAKAA
jgi:3-deoxy-D-manno-octulosonic-acid transferase